MERLFQEFVEDAEQALGDENREPPSLKEVDSIIKIVKMNMSPGIDEVTVEMQKLLEGTGNTPKEWSESTLCPIR